MIQIKLEELMKQKGKSQYRLSKQTNISEGNLRKLAKHKTTSIEFSVLERICKELDCQPGDLLVFVEDVEKSEKT